MLRLRRYVQYIEAGYQNVSITTAKGLRKRASTCRCRRSFAAANLADRNAALRGRD